MCRGKQFQRTRRMKMQALLIKDVMYKREQKKWEKVIGDKLNEAVQRPNGDLVYTTKGMWKINSQILKSAGIVSKFVYNLVDGYVLDDNGLYTYKNGDLFGGEKKITPIEVKYRGKNGNYQLNTRQLSVPGLLHLLYDQSFNRVREYTFEQLTAMPNWRVCNQLQFNPDKPGKTLREVFLDMHADISRVERRLVEKDKTEKAWLYTIAKEAAEATVAAAVGEKIE